MNLKGALFAEFISLHNLQLYFENVQTSSAVRPTGAASRVAGALPARQRTVLAHPDATFLIILARARWMDQSAGPRQIPHKDSALARMTTRENRRSGRK